MYINKVVRGDDLQLNLHAALEKLEMTRHSLNICDSINRLLWSIMKIKLRILTNQEDVVMRR